MMLKFLNQGGTQPKLAVKYCKAVLEPEHGGRDAVVVLRGSPKEFVRIAEALPFRERYKSAVIAWAPGDVPTSGQLDELLKDFQEVSFAGLSPDRFCWCVFLHQKGSRTDVHVLVATVDLETGKHFNPAPPGWMKSYDPLRDMHNYRHGWSSPADPRLARAVQPGSRPRWVAAKLREALAVEPNTKQVLQDFVLDLVLRKKVRTRADIVAVLAQHGEITRTGKNSLSIKPENFSKSIRLRGTMFQRDFDALTFQPPKPKPKADRTDAEREADKSPAAEAAAKIRLDAAIQRRAEVNRQRYQPKKRRVKTADGPLTPPIQPSPDHQVMNLSADPADRVRVPSLADLVPVLKHIGDSASSQPDDLATKQLPVPALSTSENRKPQTSPTSAPYPTQQKAQDGQTTGTDLQGIVTGFIGRLRAELEAISAAFARRVRARLADLAAQMERFGNQLARKRAAHAARDQLARAQDPEAGTKPAVERPGSRAP